MSHSARMLKRKERKQIRKEKIIMKQKKSYLQIGLLLAAFSLLPFACPAQGKDQVPFAGLEVGSLSAGLFNFPIATIIREAEGEATHLGHFTVSGEYFVNVLDASATGTFTITAANGDQIFITSVGHSLQPPTLKETVEDVTVTGGTGRFAGATGSWFMDAHVAFVFGDPDIINPYVATLEGTISTPGANKK
jgi:hypothetical protein